MESCDAWILFRVWLLSFKVLLYSSAWLHAVGDFVWMFSLSSLLWMGIWIFPIWGCYELSSCNHSWKGLLVEVYTQHVWVWRGIAGSHGPCDLFFYMLPKSFPKPHGGRCESVAPCCVRIPKGIFILSSWRYICENVHLSLTKIPFPWDILYISTGNTVKTP